MRNKSLDGLRGLAALNVTLGHFVSAFIPALLYKNYPMAYTNGENEGTAFSILTSPFVSLAFNGHFAVVIFFVLSGFVLTSPYFIGAGDDVLKKRFFGRYVRLNLPIAASILLSFLICKLGLYYNVEAAALSGSKMFIGDYFTHDITLSTLFGSASYQSVMLGDKIYNHPLWTLRFEFIGSLLLLAFYICKPQKWTSALSFLACAVLYVFMKMESIYFIALFAGALLNQVKIASKWTPGLLVAGLYLGGFQFMSPLYDFWPSINTGNIEVWDKITFYNLIGALCLVAAVANGCGQKILESRVCQFLGEISFPIYLLHFLIICSLSSALYINLPQSAPYLIANLGVYLAVCCGLGKLFAVWVDQPAIRLSHKAATFLFKEKQAS